MQGELKQLLHAELPMLCDDDCCEALRYICGGADKRTISSFVYRLIAAGAPPHSLLLSLMHCERMMTRNLLSASHLTSLEAMKLLSRYTNGFRALRQAVIAAGANRAGLVQVNPVLSSVVLEKFHNHWRKQGSVMLFNYYHEMPVTAAVKFLSAEGMCIRVEANADVERVFAAGEDQRQALTGSPDGRQVLRLELVESWGPVLTLAVTEIDEASRELRLDVRVQPGESVPVTASCSGRSIEAQMRDISLGGICLEADEQIALREGDLRGGHWRIESEPVEADSSLRWHCSDREQGCRVGAEFVPSDALFDRLIRYMLSEQRRLIERLGRLFSHH